MANIERWDPFRDLMSLRDAMDRLVEQSFIWPGQGDGTSLLPFTGGRMAIDVYETDQDVVVKATVPGVKPEDIDINLTGDILTIKTETKEDVERKDKNYVHRERRFGAMSRSMTLPTAVQSDKAEAKFENGVLTLTLPKAKEAKPKQIKIKAGVEQKKLGR